MEQFWEGLIKTAALLAVILAPICLVLGYIDLIDAPGMKGLWILLPAYIIVMGGASISFLMVKGGLPDDWKDRAFHACNITALLAPPLLSAAGWFSETLRVWRGAPLLLVLYSLGYVLVGLLVLLAGYARSRWQIYVMWKADEYRERRRQGAKA